MGSGPQTRYNLQETNPKKQLRPPTHPHTTQEQAPGYQSVMWSEQATKCAKADNE